MGVKAMSGERSSAMAGQVDIYKLSDSKGRTIKMYHVPIASSATFQKVMEEERTKLESEMKETLSLVKMEKIY